MPYANADTQRTYKRDWARMERAGECGTPNGTRLPSEFRLRKATDVLELLEEQVNAVRTDTEAGKLEKARCIAYVASVALKAIEAGDLAARLEAMESILKTRKGTE